MASVGAAAPTSQLDEAESDVVQNPHDMSQTRSKDMGDSSITRLYRTTGSIKDFYIEKNLVIEIRHRGDVGEYFEDTCLYMFRILMFDSEFYCGDALVIENDPNNNTAGFWKYMDDFIVKKEV